MTAGKKDRSIEIQSVSITQDDYGAPVETWTKLADEWAQFLIGGGNERFSGQQVFAETEARFRIRYRADITPLNRIIFGGRAYDILAVEEETRRSGLTIRVKARAE